MFEFKLLDKLKSGINRLNSGVNNLIKKSPVLGLAAVLAIVAAVFAPLFLFPAVLWPVYMAGGLSISLYKMAKEELNKNSPADKTDKSALPPDSSARSFQEKSLAPDFANAAKNNGVAVVVKTDKAPSVDNSAPKNGI